MHEPKFTLSPYSRLVEKLGEAGAKLEMKRRRALVKTPGLANSSKETIMRVNKAMIEGRKKLVLPKD